MTILVAYIAIFVGAYFAVQFIASRLTRIFRFHFVENGDIW